MVKRPSWDEFYLALADSIALRSKDTSTKVGAVIVRDRAVLSMGYNGMPRGIDDDVEARHERPMKYHWFEHGERNAIYNAARLGVSTLGATMYTQGVPCSDCARAVVQAGLQRLVARYQADSDRWRESCAVGRQILEEAGVEVVVCGNCS